MPDNPTATEAPAQTAPAADAIPIPKPSEPTEATADAALDKVFKSEAKAEKRPEPPEPKVETETEQTEERADTEAQAEAPAIDRDALTRALGVLRRDNVPDAVLEHWMENDPSKLLTWAERAGKRQGDIDKILSGKKPEPEAKETTEEPKAEPTGQPADDTALADLVRPFAEEMGSEHAHKALTGLARHVRESTLAEVRPAFEQFQRQVGVIASMLERIAVREARASLRERFPQVADDSTWARVLERAKILSESKGYQDIEEIVTDATKLETADLSVRDRQAELAKQHKARSNGTPTPPTRARKRTPATPDEQREAVLDEIFGG